MNAIKALIGIFITIIMVGVVSTTVFLVFDEMGAFSDYAGDNEVTMTNTYGNIQNAVIVFLGLLLIGSLLVFIIGRNRKQNCMGGECYEFNNRYLR